MSHAFTVTLMPSVAGRLVHKKLWIVQLVHALTVALFRLVHALTVAPSRINGRASIYILYLPVIKTPVVRAALPVDSLAADHRRLGPATSF